MSSTDLPPGSRPGSSSGSPPGFPPGPPGPDPAPSSPPRSTLEGPKSVSSRVVAGTTLQVFARLWSSVCSMGVWMVLGRLLDDAGEGLYAYYFTLFMIAGPLLDFGAFGISVREIAKHPERETAILRYAARFRLLMGAFCAVSISTLALLREPGVSGVLIALSSVHLLALSPATVGAHFQARLRFGPLAFPLIAGSSVFLGLSALFSLGGVDRPEPYLIAYGVGIVVQSLGTFFWGAGSTSPFGRVDREQTRGLFREMAPIGISATATALYFQVDAVLLRELAGEAAVGQYNHAFRLLTFAVMVPITCCQALYPVLSRYWLDDRAAILPVVQRTSTTLLGVILPAVAIAPFLGDSVIALVFGASSVSAGSVQSLAILGGAGVAIYLSYPAITALTAIGRQATFTRIALAVMPFKFAAIWILFRAVGLPGVALAALFTECVVLLCVSLAIRRYLGATGFCRRFWRPCFAALPVAAVAFMIRDVEGPIAIGSAVALEFGGMLLAGAFPPDLGVKKEP